MHSWKRIAAGIMFLGIGIGYLGTQLKWWDFTIFFPGWWSLFLILPGLASIWEYGVYISNTSMVLLGSYFLARANHWMDVRLSFPIVMGVVCICIGLRLLCKRRVKWYEHQAWNYED